MAKICTISISTYPLAPGATTAAQPIGISAPTFSTPPVAFQQDTIKYTGTAFGTPLQIAYYPTMMSPEDIVSAFRNAGVTDATLNNEGQLVFPSGITLSGTNYLGF